MFPPGQARRRIRLWSDGQLKPSTIDKVVRLGRAQFERENVPIGHSQALYRLALITLSRRRGYARGGRKPDISRRFSIVGGAHTRYNETAWGGVCGCALSSGQMLAAQAFSSLLIFQ